MKESFSKLVAERKIRQPHQNNFSASEWKRSFEGLTGQNEKDISLFYTGLWFDLKLSLIRKLINKIKFSYLTYEDCIHAFTGLSNMEAIKIRETYKARKTNENLIDFTELPFQKPNIKNPLGETFDYETLIMSLVESIRKPLLYAKDIKEKFGLSEVSESQITDDLKFNEFCLFRGFGESYGFFEAQWLACVNENWRIIPRNGISFLVPLKNENYSKIVQESESRRQALLAEMVMHSIRLLESKQRSKILFLIKSNNPIKECILTDRGFDFIDADESSEVFFSVLQIRNLIGFSHLNSLLKIPFKKNKDINLEIVLKIWETLFLLSYYFINQKNTPTKKEITSVDELKEFSFSFTKRELKNIIKKHNKIKDSEIEFIIDFFTLHKEKNPELWARPLIEITNEVYTFSIPSIFYCNIINSAEMWLRDGIEEYEVKGKNFEGEIKSELLDCINDSKFLNHSKIISKSKFSAGRKNHEEIDLLIKIEDFFFVGELKCNVSPTDPISTYNQIKILNEASKQIRRKVDFLNRNWPHLKNDLEITENGEEKVPSFFPFILTSSGFGVGNIFEGVPVTDRLILSRYFIGYWESILYLRERRMDIPMNRKEFYSNKQEAKTNFFYYLFDPPQIYRYKKFLRLNKFTFPPLTSEDTPLIYFRYEFIDFNPTNNP